MSRHNGKNELFQISILVLNKHNGHRRDGISYDRREDGTKYNIRKLADMGQTGEQITKMRHFKNSKAARVWASKFGTVLACQKIDTHSYYESIERRCRDCISAPPVIPITIDREEFSLDKDLAIRKVSTGRVRYVIDKDD